MVREDITHKDWCHADFTDLHGLAHVVCVDFTEGNRGFHRFMQMRFSLFHTEVTDILLELHVYKHEQQAQSVGYRTDL